MYIVTVHPHAFSNCILYRVILKMLLIYLLGEYLYLSVSAQHKIYSIYKLHAQYYASLFIYLLLIMVRHSSGVHLLQKPLFIYVDNRIKQINMMIACEVICFRLSASYFFLLFV